MTNFSYTGPKLGQVFNIRSGHLHLAHLGCYRVKLLSLKLKTRPKQLLVLSCKVSRSPGDPNDFRAIRKGLLVLCQAYDGNTSEMLDYNAKAWKCQVKFATYHFD